MQQENSSSSSTSPVNGGVSPLFMCQRCPKMFKSRRSLSGHQKCHRLTPGFKSFKGKRLGKLSPAFATSHFYNQEPETSINPPTDHQPPAINGEEDRSSAVQQKPKAKKTSTSAISRRHPYKKRADKADQPELRTIDYLGEWNSASKVGDGEGTSTPAFVDVARVDNSDDLNFELQLGPMQTHDKPELELKLGF